MNAQRKNLKSAKPLSRQENTINKSKRDNLKKILIEKFKSKYGAKANEDIISKEVTQFLLKEKLNDNDFKNLDKTIEMKLTQYNSKNNLKSNLKSKISNQNDFSKQTSNNNEDELNNSNMSGASNLSEFDEKDPQAKRNQETVRKFVKNQSQSNNCTNNANNLDPNFDFSAYPDEWTAIAEYNKEEYEKQKIIDRQKEREVKNRTKTDLDFQVKQKIKKNYEQSLKEKESDLIMLKHLDKIDEIERQKALEIKKRILKEKESRDVQIKDAYVRKRIETLKNKKYERELIEHLNKEIEREKQIALEKKLKEKKALEKTLKENELHKKIVQQQKMKEREDDIKAMEDNDRVKEKQELERVLYFKNIERNSNNFMTQAVQTVLKEQAEKDKEEQEKRDKYTKLKEQKEIEAENEEIRKRNEMKKTLRAFYDKQVEDKKKRKEIEKEMDKAQKNIWIQDEEYYRQHNKEVDQIIRNMNIKNLDTLKSQIESRKNKNGNKMTPQERQMNKELLQKIANSKKESLGA